MGKENPNFSLYETFFPKNLFDEDKEDVCIWLML